MTHPPRSPRAAAPLLALLLLFVAGLAPATAQSTVQSAAPIPAPELFDVAWDDRDDLLADLLPEHRDAAAELTAAPIYHLEWSLDAPRTLSGRMEVRVVNDRDAAWRTLAFQLHPVRLGGALEVHAARIDGRAVEPDYARGGAVLELPLGAPLEPGDAVVAAFDYTVEVPDDPGGNYGLLALEGGILSLPHAYPALAVRGAEGWDLDPQAPYGDLGNSVAGFYRLRFELPGALEVAATGRETVGSAGQRRVVEVRAGPVRDLYVSVSDFRPLEREVGGVTVRSFARPGTEGAAQRMLDMAVDALELFGGLYGPYPYRELDLVPLETSALGVEFPAVVALARRLYDEVPPRGGTAEAVVAHEVAHQWFYGLVGNDQVSDPWLDESVTQYATLRYFEARHGDGGRRGFLRSLRGRAARVGDAEGRDLGAPVTAYTPREYGALIYGAGPLRLDELRAELPRGAFDAALRDYAARLRWRRAEGADLFAALERVCDCRLPPRYRAAFSVSSSP